jgi:hypothetical protein
MVGGGNEMEVAVVAAEDEPGSSGGKGSEGSGGK